MIDLVCVVADKQMEAAISALLDRPSALGIRPIEKEILRHPGHDPGCFTNPTEILRGYRKSAEHALIILDHKWEGVPTQSGEELEDLIADKFRIAEMEDWAAPIVIDPELEAWVFSGSPHVSQILGWQNRNPDLRETLERQGFLEPGNPKPHDPKAALTWALREVRKPRNSSMFRELARKVNTRRCQDRAFSRLKRLLRDWFPHTSSGNAPSDGSATSRSGYEHGETPHQDQEEAYRGRVAAGCDKFRSVREKSIRHGHPSTLHLWWARRPLAAARAVLFAQMVDDPSAESGPVPTPDAQEHERERLSE